MAREAIKHLNIIVRQYRKLNYRKGSRKEGGVRGKPDQGPPCTTIPKLLGGSLAESRLVEGQYANLGRHLPNKLSNKCNERKGVG
eukprot:9472840-Pyramimonas_sp.AAC.1